MKNKYQVSVNQAYTRLTQTCARREICSSDARKKLSLWKIKDEYQDEIIKKLIKAGYIDDRRYAELFCRDKQNLAGWGREKIRYALINKKIENNIIEDALKAIEPEDFERSLDKLLEKKSRELSKFSPADKKNRLIRYALQHGFEYSLIFSHLDKFLKD